MQDIMQLLQTSSFINYFGYFVGLISVIGVIITYRQSRRGQKPKYLTMTSSFQSKLIEHSSIEIRHSGKQIQDFAITKLAIWNAGTTIKREDVATKDPLHITAKNNTQILEAQLLYAEKQNDVKWNLNNDGKQILIDFEYLAHNEGMVLKVFHTGTDTSDLSIMKGLEVLLRSKET